MNLLRTVVGRKCLIHWAAPAHTVFGATGYWLCTSRARRLNSAVSIHSREKPRLTMQQIKIRGARTHNLKNISVDLPRDKLIVITGLSGSGKSSLAFDTLYAEGQRRYVESLSAYARQFLSMMDKPDVDSIEGLSPAIAIEQKATSHNPRSTVGTVTEIYDYLRLLFARAGIARCPDHGIDLAAQTVSQMVDQIVKMPEGLAVLLLAPIVIDRKGEHAEVFEQLRGQGFVRVRIDGRVHELDALPKIDAKKKHTIEVVVDRLRIRADAAQRLSESLETALKLAGGTARLAPYEAEKVVEAGRRNAVLLAPGLPGVRLQRAGARTEDVLVQQPRGRLPHLRRHRPQGFLRSAARRRLSASLARGRRHQELGSQERVLLRADHRDGKHYKFDPETPWEDLSKKAQQVMLFGSGNDEVEFRYVHGNGRTTQEETPLRRHHSEPRAALQGNRLVAGARGAREVSRLASPAPTATARGSIARRETCSWARTACRRSRI